MWKVEMNRQMTIDTYARDDWQVNIEQSGGFYFDASEDHYWNELVDLSLEPFVSRKFAFRVLHAFCQKTPHILNAMTTDENHPQL